MLTQKLEIVEIFVADGYKKKNDVGIVGNLSHASGTCVNVAFGRMSAVI